MELYTKMDFFNMFKKYMVQAESVKDFCEKYHRRDAYHDRGAEYMDVDLQSHIKELEQDGYTIIPKGSSVTGDTVTYYG